MTPGEIILLNFNEIRRRSIKLWEGLPPDFYSWRPDSKAMSGLEMIRHVLEGEHLFHVIVNNRGNLAIILRLGQTGLIPTCKMSLILPNLSEIAF